MRARRTKKKVVYCATPNAGLATMALVLYAGSLAEDLDVMTVRFAQSLVLTVVERDALLVRDALAALDADGAAAQGAQGALTAAPRGAEATSKAMVHFAIQNAAADTTTLHAAHALRIARRE